MASVNKVIIVGNLGKDPEVKALGDGRKVMNLSVATSEHWNDKRSGERREKTEWHRVVVFNEGIIGFAEKYATKGSQVFLQGKLVTRKWTDQKGEDRFTTEIELGPYNAEFQLLGGGAGKGGNSISVGGNVTAQNVVAGDFGSGPKPRIDDQIPF